MANDVELDNLLDRVRDHIMPFATAEWIELAPTFVREIEHLLNALPPGMTFGESIAQRPPPTIAFSSPAPREMVPSGTAKSSAPPAVHLTPASSSGQVAPALTPTSSSGPPVAPPSDSPSSTATRPTRSNRKAPQRYRQDAPLPSTLAPNSPAVPLSAPTIDPAPEVTQDESLISGNPKHPPKRVAVSALLCTFSIIFNRLPPSACTVKKRSSLASLWWTIPPIMVLVRPVLRKTGAAMIQ